MSRARVLAGLIIATVLMAAQPSARWQPPSATPLMVAAASDLQSALPDLVARFEKETGTKVSVSFGSSGTFFAQIANGAPFDVFFSADLDYPKRLVADGHADADTLYQYATGRIVVWTRKDAAIPIERGLQSLLDSRVRKVAIANPVQAPYGRAAVAALQHEKIYDTIRGKLVFGENISQTAQLVESGNADVGILAMSLARGPALSSSGTYVEIPATTHPPIDQGVVVVTASRNKPAARALIAYLQRPEVKQLFQHFGFGAAR
jgi:molybdate transport system substrate-binding protein